MKLVSRRHRGEPRTELNYNKLCELEDFAHPGLRARMREFDPGAFERWPAFPSGREHRKHWEVAMTARTLMDFGVLGEGAEVLGVGAGDEATIFWLTSRVKRVFATDLYLDPGTWEKEASASMLVAPERHAPCPWDPRRLVVQHMNALDLRYEDESFDAVFSSSSIEHFGTHDDVRRSAEEMCRVLKPGGIASVSTEFRIDGPPPGLPGALLFSAGELERLAVAAGEWELVADLDLSLSPRTRETGIEHASALAGVAGYPHIVIRHGAHAWTSVHLALRKRARASES